MRHFLVALALIAPTLCAAQAADPTPGLPSDLEVITPSPQDQQGPIIDYEEPDPDVEPFLKAGFSLFQWQKYSNERDNVLRNIVAPDYRRRRGKDPAFGTFDFVLQNVTGGKYNDIVVWSNLPDDCDPSGCKLLVFKMDDAGKWNVVADFQAITILHRYAAGPDPDKPVPELAAPGDATTPTTIYRWNGSRFVER